MKTKLILVSALLVFTMYLNAQKYENLALTPPIGWNSWNKFAQNVDEKMIREIADAMVTTGMKDAGYEYIVIDDYWHGKRDTLGFIHPDKDRFPSGIKALADYIHSKGLKFGIYSCAGHETCGHQPGSRGFEYQDALMYAKWGVDYLKYDWCSTKYMNTKEAYPTMSKALKAAGRPIVFSLCEWGSSHPWEWAGEVGHLWRTTGDIYNCFDCVDDHGNWKAFGVLQIMEMNQKLRAFAGPGKWNDPDMLEVGNGMPANEARSHFSLWCMMASPLIAGNDLRAMDAETISILTNKDMIAVDQDSLGIQGFRFEVKDSVETWLKPLAKNAWALMYFNRSFSPKTIMVDWKNVQITDTLTRKVLNTTQKNIHLLRDLWQNKEIGNTKKPFKKTIPARDVVCLKVYRKD